MPGLKDIISGGFDGILSGAADIIAKFKADPTKVIETQTELEKLKIAAAQKVDELEVQMEQEITKRIESENAAVSARWNADMTSDSWLSKNARPIVLLGFILFTILLIVFDSTPLKFVVKESWVNLVEMVDITVIGAYFGGRTWEKHQSIRKK